MGLFPDSTVREITMADDDQKAAELKKRRTFRKFTYRGVDLDQLLDMSNEQLMELFPCRMRRKFTRGLKRKPMALIKKLRKKKRECPANEKPDVVKTHLRNMVIVPEMTGSMVGVYNGKLQPGRDQARDDRSLPGRVLHHLQASQARKARYRCHPLVKIYSSQVNRRFPIFYVYLSR